VSYQPELAGDYIRILAVSLPVAVATVVATKVLRFEKRPKSTVVLTFLQALTLIGFNVLFVLVLGMGLTGAFYAKLVAGVLMVPLALKYINRWIGKFRLLDFGLLKEMVRYSLPFIPASISIWMINLSAVFFLNGKVTDADLGLFQVAFTLAGFGGIVVNSFQQAWAPFAFSIIHQENAKETYGKILLVYLMVIGSITLLISLFSLEALMIIATPSYYGAAAIASILVFSAMFSGLTNIADLGSAISKKTAPLGMVYSMSAVILVVLNIFLIPKYGVIGAALAVSISQLISPIFVFYFSQKVYPIPYDFVRATFFVGLIFIAGYAGYYFSSGLEVLESIGLKILAFLIFSGLSIWLFSREFFLAKSLIMNRFRG
jgi:O-antigen/teichoic acid export membrane protein